MKLSDTQRIVLSHGAQHPQLLAIAPKHLPVAACRAVVNSLIKSRLLIEVAAPRDQLAMVWRKDADGTPILIQVTDEGLRAIGIDPNEGRAVPDTAPQGGEDTTTQAEEQPAAEPAQAAPEAPNMASVNLREAAERLLAAWEETPPANADKDPIARAMDMLRSALSRRATRATGAPRKPREGTKQEVVLAMLRRPEGATVAQIGFHISALYSPVGWLSWEQIARDWEAAQGKAEDLKTSRNTVLGETWQDRGEAPDWERLVERREDFRLGVVAQDALVLTAGVDVQDDRLECDIWAWAEGYSSWLVDHIVIAGSPRERAPWDALADLLARDWSRANGGAIRIAKACVDTGGRDTAAVYGHLRRLRDPRIAPTKGVDGWNRAQPVQGPTPVDALVDGRKLRRGLKLWTVSVSTWKVDLYRRLWLGRGEAAEFPPGWVHLPQGIEVEWVKQLVAEQLHQVKDRRGFVCQEWAKLRDRNEALDCAVLARAALWLLGADRYGERFWQRLREDIANAPVEMLDHPRPEPAANPEPPPLMRRPGWLAPRSGWLR